MRSVRSDIYDPSEVAVVHVMTKTVRHMYLFGEDPITKKSYNHRRDWIESQLFVQAKYFGIDLIAYAVQSNHFHLILCSRPDIVSQWDDTEVARRWLHLCPKRKDVDGKPMEPTEKELDKIRAVPTELKKIRTRLSDISWWMRLLCQKVAQKANWEMGETGRFFNGRFKAVRLLDDDAILAGMTYVELNQIRARASEKIEESHHASISKRVKALTELSKRLAERADRHLRPIELQDSAQPDVPNNCKTSYRCSNKGLFRMTAGDYINLVDMTAKLPREDKPGTSPETLPPILERLGMDLETWALWTHEFDSLFSQAAGRAKSLDEARTLVTKRKYYCRAYRGKHA